MNRKREFSKLFQIVAFAVALLMVLLLVSFVFIRKWEKQLVQEKQNICTIFAQDISERITQNDTLSVPLKILLEQDSVSLIASTEIDKQFTAFIEDYIYEVPGLEGGIYLYNLDRFFGYAYPTSPPPIPVYGPPPRSYNIIRAQARETAIQSESITNMHAFDPAVFPLATSPLMINDVSIGAVWIRIHIERQLPINKLKRGLNIFTIISLAGFLVAALFSFFLRTGIKNIRKELEETKNNPGFRLKIRGGWFGFIPASINEMLDEIDKVYAHRRDLEQRLQQKRKLASLGKMIAGVAHEVKTPLSIIKMRIQMWQRELENNPELKAHFSEETLELVLNEIDRLTDLVKRLVVFSRPISSNMQAVNIDSIIDEVLSLVEPKLGEKTIRIKKKLIPNTPSIEADPGSLKQVLLNVLTNSIESIAQEGEILVATSHDSETQQLILTIGDTGAGIPEEILKSIFDPFFTTKEHGTGLGLSICHEILTAHGGSIEFSRDQTYGAICRIVLPIKPLSNNSNYER